MVYRNCLYLLYIFIWPNVMFMYFKVLRDVLLHKGKSVLFFFFKFICPKVNFFFNELKFFCKRNNVKECIVCYIFCPKVIM